MLRKLLTATCIFLLTAFFALESQGQSCWYNFGEDDSGSTVTWTSLTACDDCSSGAIPLGFSFDLYGSNYDTLYMNSNGNLSFGGSYNVYNPTGFPNNLATMIAPFYADVDLRGGAATWGYYVDGGDGYAIFNWEGVRHYFGPSATRINTFQVIITDGTRDDLTGPGNNVCFNYGGMEWTTGTASGGSGGFGGIPAFVGMNRGDSINGMEYGRFDAPGTYFDGAGGLVDEVDHLDSTCFCFDADLAVLPVNLISYQAQPLQNRTVSVTWATATETINDYFLVERAGDDFNFHEIGRIEGAGNSVELRQYQFIDEQPLQGKNYYRLTQVDFNGEFEQFGVREVDMQNGVENLGISQVAPNPAQDELQLVLTSGLEGDATIVISTIDGRQILSQDLRTTPGFNNVDIDLTSIEHKGILLLSVLQQGEVSTTKFVKQ